ncbi:MAG: hypothetical protein WC604_04005 [Candidatus Gracilibacteria bacterium]
MLTAERQFILKFCTRDREDLMYEVFLEKGLDVFLRKECFQRVQRPLVKYEF